MTDNPLRKSGLNGPAGLIVGIIAQAADDLNGAFGREPQLTAHYYFQSALYRHHMEILGLDPDAYPMALDPEPCEREVYRILSRPGKRSWLWACFDSTERGREIIAKAKEAKALKLPTSRLTPIISPF